jgi:hypothetical protein
MKAGRAPQQFTVSPKEIIGLYHRCVRCLTLRVRENDMRRVPVVPNKFYDSAVQVMDDLQSAHAWQYVGDKQFRVISHGQHVVSQPIEFEDVNVQLRFSTQSDAVLELKDGTRVVAAYNKAVPVERRQKDRDLEIEAQAFALENPAETSSAHQIGKLGIVEFLVAGPQESSAVIGPSRLTLLDRYPKQLADFTHVVARILAARFAPPANAHCPYCKQTAVSR